MRVRTFQRGATKRPRSPSKAIDPSLSRQVTCTAPAIWFVSSPRELCFTWAVHWISNGTQVLEQNPPRFASCVLGIEFRSPRPQPHSAGKESNQLSSWARPSASRALPSMASGIGESTPAASDRKKRALEALERRFAAEAERLQEHHHQEDQKAKRARIPVGDGESEQRKRFHSLEGRYAAEAGRLHHQDSRKSKRAPNSAGDNESEKQKEGHPTTSAASASSKKGLLLFLFYFLELVFRAFDYSLLLAASKTLSFHVLLLGKYNCAFYLTIKTFICPFYDYQMKFTLFIQRFLPLCMRICYKLAISRYLH